MNFLKYGISATLLSTALFAGTYNVDSSHSTVGFKVKHMMISNVTGNFNNFNGSFEFDKKTNSLKSLKGEVQTASINTENQKRDEHLKSADFFDAKKFPKITFELTKIKDNKAYGNLTMHGITKEVELNYENSGEIKDPWGNTRMGLALNGVVNRYDFGLKYNSALETGGVAVGENVKLDIELEGILAK